MVGAPSDTDRTLLQSVRSTVLVTLDWLLESIRQLQPAPEYPFVYTITTTTTSSSTSSLENLTFIGAGADQGDASVHHASPASKKNIESMTSIRRRTPQPRRLVLNSSSNEGDNSKTTNKNQLIADRESTLLAQYANAAASTSMGPPPTRPAPGPSAAAAAVGNRGLPSVLVDDLIELDSVFEARFLIGKKVAMHGFIDDSINLMAQEMRAAGGELMDEHYDGELDYLIVPIDVLQMDDINVRAKNIVNELWLVST